MAGDGASASAKEVPEGCTVISEGRASILQQANKVFYNKAQVVNRDISIAVLKWFIETRKKEADTFKAKSRAGPLPKGTPVKKDLKGVKVLEGLAASGLRALRYAQEIPDLGQVVANDLDSDAVRSMKRNIAFNGGAAETKVQPSQADARLVMLQHKYVFDAVDLDPYGTPAELLDSAVESVADGGLMLVTATDMAVLCGNHAETCFTKYGSYSLHRDYNHEQALRILLASLAQHAARHKRVIVPILSLSIDFYIRVFVRVYTSPSIVKETASKLSYVWQSTGCDAFWLQPVGSIGAASGAKKYNAGRGPAVPQQCPISDGKFAMGGPIWNRRLHDPDAVKAIFDGIKANKEQYPAHAKVLGLLTAVQEELLDSPLYYTISSLARTFKATSPKMALLRNALVNAGYAASPTHCNKEGIKTDAPPQVVFDIMRCWVKKNAVRPKDPDSYQAKILAKEPELQADFSTAAGAMSGAKANKQTRFVENPENWGPRPRHGRPLLPHEIEEANGAGTKQPAQASDEATPAKRAKTEHAEEKQV